MAAFLLNTAVVQAVPANLTRYGLSQVVNHLLGLEDAVPFDFLVRGELLRLSLGKLLLSQNLSTESVLEVEYFLAVAPPEQQRQLPHDDWVSAVDGALPDTILTGCYDGQLRIWNGKGDLLGSLEAHRGPISAVQALPNSQMVLSAGKLDHTVRLISLSPNAVDSSSAVAVYKGHAGSVLDVASAPSGDRFVSASQDKSLRIWPAGDSVASQAEGKQPEGNGKKRQKLQNGAAASLAGAEVQHAAELSGHSDAVTSAIWSLTGHIFSGSMDHSVRKWDAQTETHTDTFNGRKAVSSIALSRGASEIVAVAGAARALLLWDPRKRQADDAGVKTFSSHTSHIHAVAWHPESEHHLITASMDKTLKLWDTRSSIPLHTLDGHSEQVLCTAWWRRDAILSGAADNTVQIFRLPNGLHST